MRVRAKYKAGSSALLLKQKSMNYTCRFILELCFYTSSLYLLLYFILTWRKRPLVPFYTLAILSLPLLPSN
ncbi:hypothetical protein [Pontibacter flavimaris]|uniref:hypothetical protein n=1 Tax=Pontibacter flavimaris TaxID=1797110 RepID=UPI0011152E8D|nr:hypothetical protein [Pontibacter flavimaris]